MDVCCSLHYERRGQRVRFLRWELARYKPVENIQSEESTTEPDGYGHLKIWLPTCLNDIQSFHGKTKS